ncbi:MAG: efflux RND transporter periplasmic adaptor subunit [Pseudomonadota bacterium]
MKRTCLLSCLALTILVGPPARAAAPLGCLIEPSQSAELGSPVIGVLDKVMVERGDFVKKGQVLATLRAGVEQASLNVARQRAQAEAELRAAEANRDFARQQVRRAEDLGQQNFISKQAIDQAQTELKVAEQRLVQARDQKRIWDKESALAQAQLAQRKLLSPFSGVVVDRYLSPGERVEDRPVLRLAALHPLRVEVFMPAASFGQIKTGMTATVAPDLPGMAEAPAKVTLVDRVIDPASNTFRVRLSLPNRDHAIPAGARCQVRFPGLETAPPAQSKPKPAKP